MKRALILAASCFLAGSDAAASPAVELFSPQGTVKQVRQATARFSEPMVPFGDPRGLVEPFSVDCPAKGRARWADPRNWVFDFDEDLKAGVRCSFKLKDGVKALSGGSMGGLKEFAFSTGGPAVVESHPYEGEYSRIAEDQIFLLALDAEAERASVLSHLSFSIDGVLESVGARLIEGAERETVLAAARWQTRERVVVVGAQRRLPPDAKVRLIWGKGIATPSGVETAQDQTLAYKVRPDFTAKFSCERASAKEGCIPFLPLRVELSGPVSWKQAEAFVIQGQGGSWKPQKPKRVAQEEESEGEGSEAVDDNQFTTSVSFAGPFPPEAALTVELPKDLRDDSGRGLSNASSYPLSVRTADYPPLAKFPASFGILELKGGAVLPVTLRQLEPEVKARLLQVSNGSGKDQEQGLLDRIKGSLYQTPASAGPYELMSLLSDVQNARREAPALREGKPISIPKPNGPKAFEVVGIPFKETGFYAVELESPKLGASLLEKKGSMFVAAAALVTDLAVHLVRGREGSVVWVTSLSKGEPVPGAAVTVADCSGKTLWEGRTGQGGLAAISSLPSAESLPGCRYHQSYEQRWKMIAVAKLGADMSFALDSWEDGIEPWRFQLPYEWNNEPAVSLKTVFDRTLLRAGETVHMKHFIRRQTAAGFDLPPREEWPAKVVVEHLGDEQKYELPLTWSENGVAEGSWDIPKEAKLGAYSVSLEAPGEEEQKSHRRYRRPRRWHQGGSGEFRVEEFRVPLLSAQIQPPAKSLISVSSVALQLGVRYLSGGGVAGMPVRLRTQLQPKGVASFDRFEGFEFATGPAPEGVERRGGNPASPEIRAQDLTLDAAGSARTVVAVSTSALTMPMELLSELEFRDPNGETQTVASRAALWPSSRLVGLKPDSWALSKDSLKFQAAVATTNGRPLPGVPVEVSLLQRRVFSHRKRLVGGFYAYDHTEKTMRLGVVCRGITDAKGLVFCQAQSPASGSLILEAAIKDSSGRPSRSHLSVWVAGKEDWWFDVNDSDRMDVIPERKRYEPGDIAVFQVRMPFREATALVAVEREGVLDASVKKLSGKEPVVRVPVKGSYSPNVFVSVLAVRGRVGGVQPTALVDLGRPAYRLGIGEIQVGWRAHELKVAVAPERKVYKVRQKARVKLSVRLPDGSAPPAGTEAAVAAVDEGLLELMPNGSWSLLDAMMGRRSMAVRTFTAQMHVVGRRHFGLKALPSGGGGGRQGSRELFDTLLFWKARVPLDSKGEAEVVVPLNDSITGFKIAAVASAGAQRFGTGTAEIRTTQDLSVLSGVAPLAREGDRLTAMFTVRNASERPLQARVKASVSGLGSALPDRSVSLAPGKAEELGWDISVPLGVSSMTYSVEASGSGVSDKLKVSQKVIPAIPVRVFEATIAQLDKELKVPVERPKDAVPGRGGVRAVLTASLASELSGLIDYMHFYPYSCLEQMTSKAVALRDEDLWRRNMQALPSYLDSDGLAKYFPLMDQGSEVLTSYIVAIADEAGWQIPGGPRERMLEGLKGFVEGRVQRHSALPTADLALRKLAAVAALARAGKAEPKLLDSIPIDPNLWPTSGVLDWLDVLRRVKVADGERRLAEAEQILRARLNFQGTTMGFSTDTSDFLWWLMVSNDENAVRMVLSHLAEAPWKEDMPRLLRGAIGRQHHGHWDLTTANAWGRLALEKFGKAFESVPVSGRSGGELAGFSQSLDWSPGLSSGTMSFGWPQSAQTFSLRHEGTGKPWATIQSLAAIPLKEPFSSGYKIKKGWTPVQQKTPGIWSRGDVARVRVEVDAQSDMTWVVVDDPIPAGTSVLGGGLGRNSQLATQGEKGSGNWWTWPAFQERSFEAFRSYYEFVPKGTFAVEYTLRFNNEGSFSLPATRVEAMYSPEMFGELPNAAMEVKP
ncbi:MAG: alpha-2-macroglobulin [Elusimicrobia bacterium]|nr:alpha-2-macroglobulin [Elusimicrobiota bacterium]